MYIQESFQSNCKDEVKPLFASKERVPICGMPISKERAYKAINSSSFEKSFITSQRIHVIHSVEGAEKIISRIWLKLSQKIL